MIAVEEKAMKNLYESVWNLIREDHSVASHRRSTARCLGLTALICWGVAGGIAETSFAQRGEPASLLIMPEFDNRSGAATILTVTNTNWTEEINAQFIYLSSGSCLEFNRTETLSPRDTITVLTNAHNPTFYRGYVYVYAKTTAGEGPVSFNWLTGTCTSVDGLENFGYAVEPIAFKAAVPEGMLTDLDGDSIRDLNGLEYEMAPDQLLVPRFLGQNYNSLSTDLILINLTGARHFDATVALHIYNDNSEKSNGLHTFTCWTRTSLLSMSAAFGNAWLKAWTNHDPNEILGIPAWESGWLRIDGLSAQSSQEMIEDPAILAVLVDSGSGGEAAVLPFASGTQGNGGLYHQTETLDFDPGAGYCFGEVGVGTPCPCSNDNDGTLHGAGCDNGVFSGGARLSGFGTASVSADTLVLNTIHAEPGNSGLYFQANNAINGGDGIVFGDGLRCAGGGVIRLQVRFSNPGGATSTTNAIGTKGAVVAGDTKRYQYWYRTISNPPCGLGVNDFNLSNGYEVTWLP
jgi:hypothetical protein